MNERRPTRTREQYSQADGVAVIASSIGLAVIVLLAFLWKCRSHRARRNFIISQFIYVSILASIGFLLSDTTISREDVFCRDNATPRAQSDGLSVCLVQAAFLVFTTLALSLAWLSQLIDLYLKIVRDHKSTEDFYTRYMILIYAYPTFAVLIYACSGLLGYDGSNVFCLWLRSPSGDDFDIPLLVLYLPIMVMILAGIVLLSLIAGKVIRTWYIISPENPENKFVNNTSSSIKTTRVTGKWLHSILRSSLSVRSKRRVSTTPAGLHPPPEQQYQLQPGAAQSPAQPAPEQLGEVFERNARGSLTSPAFNSSVVAGFTGTGIINIDARYDAVAPAAVANGNGGAAIDDESYNDAESNRLSQEDLETSQKKKASKMLLRKSYMASSGLLVFCVLFLFGWSFFLLLKLRIYLYRKQETMSYDSWLDCVKVNYDGDSDASWISICGEQASVYANRAPTYLAGVFLGTGQSLVVGVIFISQFWQLLRTGGGRVGMVDRELARMVQIQGSLLKRRRQRQQQPGHRPNNNAVAT